MNTSARIAVLEHAADILRREAAALAQCHLLRNVWPDDDAEARSAHDDMMLTSHQIRRFAAELRAEWIVTC